MYKITAKDRDVKSCLTFQSCPHLHALHCVKIASYSDENKTTGKEAFGKTGYKIADVQNDRTTESQTIPVASSSLTDIWNLTQDSFPGNLIAGYFS